MSNLVLILKILLIVSLVIGGIYYFKNSSNMMTNSTSFNEPKIISSTPTATPTATPATTPTATPATTPAATPTATPAVVKILAPYNTLPPLTEYNYEIFDKTYWLLYDSFGITTEEHTSVNNPQTLIVYMTQLSFPPNQLLFQMRSINTMNINDSKSGLNYNTTDNLIHKLPAFKAMSANYTIGNNPYKIYNPQIVHYQVYGGSDISVTTNRINENNITFGCNSYLKRVYQDESAVWKAYDTTPLPL